MKGCVRGVPTAGWVGFKNEQFFFTRVTGHPEQSSMSLPACCGERARAVECTELSASLAALARVAHSGGSRSVPVLVPVRASPVLSVVRGSSVVKFFLNAIELGGRSTVV